MFLHVHEPLGNIGEFSFLEAFKKFSNKKESYGETSEGKIIKFDGNKWLTLSSGDDMFALDRKVSSIFDKYIQKGQIQKIIDTLSSLKFKTVPDSHFEKHQNLNEFLKKQDGDIELQPKKTYQEKKLLEGYPEAYKFLSGYVLGSYSVKDKLLHNIPIEVDAWCKTQPRKVDVTMYRGIKYTEDWFKNEVERYDSKNNVLYLKTSSITSWSTDINVSNYFANSGFYMLLSLKFSGDVFCDLRKFNSYEKEVLLYPGRYKTKIVKNFFKMVKKEADIDF